jgi:hypothetical protein
MNEQTESENPAPPVISAPASSTPENSKPKPFSYWAKRFLVCNPCYLVSATLLLFGMYRLSVDGGFFREEISQLAFNLGSLEFYELLLVGTAVFLAARRIWYDSTLLVALENMFLFVPFILLSQVALINKHFLWVACLLTAILAAVRFGVLKRRFRELNLPGGLLLVGLPLLVINIGLLAAYRIVGETRFGWQPDSGKDYVFNQVTWLVILPAALALGNFLPHARENGSLAPQRRWLPDGFFALWGAATAVHLYCLNYVYNFAFEIAMFAPAVWIAAWTIYRRVPDVLGARNKSIVGALAVAPLLATFCAVSQTGTKTFFTLAVVNAAVYAAMFLRNRNRSAAQHLLFASLVMAVCAMPAQWIHLLTPAFGRGEFILIGIAVYVMLYVVLSRNPIMGVLGALVVATGVAAIFSNYDAALHWAVQSALAFLLLHSLGWADPRHQGAREVRCLAAGLWALHAIIWAHLDAALWMPCIFGGVVLGAYCLTQLLRGRWDLFILPAASILTILSGPGNALLLWLEKAPGGLLAMIGSFLLFALGTTLALTKHRWHPSEKTPV